MDGTSNNNSSIWFSADTKRQINKIIITMSLNWFLDTAQFAFDLPALMDLDVPRANSKQTHVASRYCARSFLGAAVQSTINLAHILSSQWLPYIPPVHTTLQSASSQPIASTLPGRKIHAGTRHFAVLPLSLAVKPLKSAEGARHDLLPCPDCQNISNWGGKVHVKLTTNHNIYFHFYMHDASAPPKFACKS